MHRNSRQNGSAIITVLIIAVIITATLMILLSFSVQHSRVLTYKGDFLKARYTAENGIQQFIASARANDSREWLNASNSYSFAFDPGDTAHVKVTPWGSFLHIASEARKRSQEFGTENYLALAPTTPFNNALLLNPQYYSLVVTGNTRLIGDVVVGRSGVKQESLSGRPYTGNRPVYGRIMRSPVDYRPIIREDFVEALFEDFREDAKASTAVKLAMLASDTTNRIELGGPNDAAQIVDIDNGLPQDRRWEIIGPGTLIADSPLLLQGAISFRNHVKILSSHPITIGSNVEMDQTIVYSTKQVTIDGTTGISGQFYSEWVIELKGEAKVEYPSVALVYAKELENGIDLYNRTEFNGSVIALRQVQDGANSPVAGLVWVAPEATVNGLLFGDNTVTLEGTVNGTIIADRFHFYYSPTNFYNWINGGRVDRTRLRDNFKLPLFFRLPNAQLSPLQGH